MITPNRADLAGLFTPAAPNDSFRQGVIVAFDPATGTNQVLVGGAVLENLPILVGGDTVNYAEDDVVILLRYQSSWAILGRIVGAGNEALTSAAVDFYAGSNGTSFFDITNAYATQGSLTIPTPTWANSALISAVATASVANTTAAPDTARFLVRINTSDPGETFQQMVNGAGLEAITASFATTLGVGGTAPLAATTTVEARIRANGATTWTGGGTASVLNAIAIFRKV